jgi:hypothetical protein
MKKFVVLSLLILAVSCGDSLEMASSPDPVKSAPQEQQKKAHNELKVPDHYSAELIAMNTKVSGQLSGAANFKIENGDFVAYIRLYNSLTSLIHEQRYYRADACPTSDADTNNDGFIDIVETNNFLGQPIFPLDADITTLEAGKDTFPAGDTMGTYWYEQIMDYNSLLDELHQGDKDSNDDFVGLSPAENISLDEGVIIIMGVPGFTVLPETVASTNGYGNFQTLPVACGSLKKVYVVPGKIEDDKGVSLPSGPVGGVNGEYDNATVMVGGNRKADNYGDDDGGGLQ